MTAQHEGKVMLLALTGYTAYRLQLDKKSIGPLFLARHPWVFVQPYCNSLDSSFPWSIPVCTFWPRPHYRS